MKTLLTSIAAISMFGLSVVHADPSRTTAKWVLGNLDETEGDRVTIDVAFVELPTQPRTDGYAVVTAHTWDEKEDKLGGSIPVVIAQADLESFARRYETRPSGGKFRRPGTADVHTQRISGTVVAEGRGAWIDLTGGDAPEDGFVLAAERRNSILETLKDKVQQRRARN